MSTPAGAPSSLATRSPASLSARPSSAASDSVTGEMAPETAGPGGLVEETEPELVSALRLLPGERFAFHPLQSVAREDRVGEHDALLGAAVGAGVQDEGSALRAEESDGGVGGAEVVPLAAAGGGGCLAVEELDWVSIGRHGKSSR
ncbi:hypothetical protein OsJ_35068 [Oryza sativa Japonica Group]|uniref:Uncharacterized protein n=1 Tax=Oryza sativa subsp. japonica TaxID=39947 RepID=A3CEJ0_ORYSJ|nr:hypothetical protein OsJ_35068 [Oryza sativa Japonica Group]